MKIHYTIFLILLYVSISAQDPYYVQYSVQDGVPSDEVYDIYVAPNQKVWLTTDRGIAAFDGYDFEVYSNKEGLAFSTHFTISPDQEGNLWFLGFDASISYYDVELDKIISHPQNDSLRSLAKGTWFNVMGQDSAGILYLGFHKYASLASTNRFLKINKNEIVSSTTLPEETGAIYALDFLTPPLYYDHKFDFWIRDFAALKTGKIIYTIPSNITLRLNQTSESYLFEYDGEVHLRYTAADLSEIFLEDDYALVGSKEGLLLFDLADFSQPKFRFFKDYFITGIDKDLEGNYWLSTLHKGILFVPSLEISPVACFGHIITDVLPFDDFLLFTENDRSLYAIDKDNRQVLIHDQKDLTYLPDLRALGSQIYLNNKFILSQENGKLVSSKNTDYYTRPMNHFLPLADNYKLIINTASISVHDPKRAIVFNSADIIDRTITTFMEYPENKVWVGTISGLYLLSVPDFKMKKVLEGVKVSDLKTDGELFVMTSLGDGLFIKNNDEWINYSSQDGLASDYINQVTIDDDCLWLATNKGIDKIRIQGDSCIVLRNFTTDEGLPSNFVNEVGIWNDKVWVATNAGLFSFQEDFKPNLQSPPSIEILDVDVENYTDHVYSEIELAPKFNTINITYKSICYRKADPFYTIELLKNGNRISQERTNNQNARFVDLSAGKYTLLARSSDKYGNQSKEATFNFRIKKRLINRLWFWCIIVGLLALLAYLGIQYRIRHILRKEEQRRALLEAELRTQIAELSLFEHQLNPHFIFNALNSIQHYIFDKDVKTANQYLAKFSKLIRSSLHMIRQKWITLAEEIDFSRRYIEIESMRFRSPILLQVEGEIDGDEYYVPPLILQPVIENSIKHGFNHDEQNQIVIRLQLTEQLVIIVEDNGKGFDANRRQGYGTKIIEDRLALLNLEQRKTTATFTLSSKTIQTGTKAIFELPIIYEI